MVSEPWLSVSNHILIVTKFNYFSAKNMGVGQGIFHRSFICHIQHFADVTTYSSPLVFAPHEQIIPHLHNLTPSPAALKPNPYSNGKYIQPLTGNVYNSR